MVWPEVGARYAQIFSRVGATNAQPVEWAEAAGGAERVEVGFGRA
jgi:hypothetical protein